MQEKISVKDKIFNLKADPNRQELQRFFPEAGTSPGVTALLVCGNGLPRSLELPRCPALPRDCLKIPGHTMWFLLGRSIEYNLLPPKIRNKWLKSPG